ncbi:MAG: glutamate--cysteine ligase [Pseudomonadota bacterium]
MSQRYQRRLAELSSAEQAPLLANIRRGLEKESLRILPNGRLAQTPHPAALGSALTHDFITTDYSEALLEFITPVSASIDETLQKLDDLHRFTYGEIGEELLWAASMPCVLEGDDNIPVARYGSSNIAKMKTAYRVGLGYRYGRLMQAIAGIHYNFSMPEAWWALAQQADGDSGAPVDYITRRYLDLIRNFRRWSWLLIYLFGISPAVCASFLRNNNDHGLVPFDEQARSLHAPYGTSLRMGDLGYQSNAQKGLPVCYNSLDSYITTLKQAIVQPHPAYVDIGLGSADAPRQLNTSLLQIENEFYSPIRPKRVAHSGETPLGALRRDGIEYIEVRCIDVNPYLPLGIDAAQIRFMDCFLLHCLLADSAQCDEHERRRIATNTLAIVNRGREPGLLLDADSSPQPMGQWAEEILGHVETIAMALDAADGGNHYQSSVQKQRQKVAAPDTTPSATLLAEMRDTKLPFFTLAMQYSQRWADHFRGSSLDSDRLATLRAESEASLARQRAVEAADADDFENFLAAYYRQYDAL